MRPVEASQTVADCHIYLASNPSPTCSEFFCMKWLPTTLILFSVGIICVIAETTVANPWDRFVSDQQKLEAQTIRCDFTTGVGAN